MFKKMRIRLDWKSYIRAVSFYHNQTRNLYVDNVARLQSFVSEKNEVISELSGKILHKMYPKLVGLNHKDMSYSETEGGDDICGNFQYFHRREEKQNHVSIYRRPLGGSTNSDEKVLDLNDIASWWPNHFSLCQLKPSLDSNFIGFLLETTNHENDKLTKVLYLKHLSKNIVCRISFPDYFIYDIVDFEWYSTNANDACTLYVTATSDGVRPSKVIHLELKKELLFGMGWCNDDNNFNPPPRGRTLNISKRSYYYVFEEKDPAFFLSIRKSKDSTFMIIHCHSKSSSECWLSLIPHLNHNSNSKNPIKLFRPRETGLRYFIDYSNGNFYIASNLNKKSTNVSIIPSNNCSISNDLKLFRYEHRDHSPYEVCYSAETEFWTQIWPNKIISTTSGMEEEGGSMEDWDLFEDAILIYGRCRLGRPALWRILLSDNVQMQQTTSQASAQHSLCMNVSGEIARALMPTDSVIATQTADNGSTSREVITQSDSYELNWAFHISPGANAMYQSNEAIIIVTSLTHNDISFSLDLQSGSIRRLTPANSSSTFHTQSLVVPSHDGVLIPLTLLTPKNGSVGGPVLLSVYGSYGICAPMARRAQVDLLLERGWSFAVAHVRGGGEFGQRWHASGRGLFKRNSFLDYRACAEHLLASGLCAPGQLFGEGRSAGGLICAVAMNEFPELFAGFILRNPYVDPYGTIVDRSQPLSSHEQDEWGCEGAPEDVVLPYIKSYSPLHNIRAQAASENAPTVLVTVGDYDVSVNPNENALKWATAMISCRRAAGWTEQDILTKSPVLIRIQEGVGHEGPASATEQAIDDAVEVVFLESVLTSSLYPNKST